MWETLESSLIDFQTVCLIRPMLDKTDYQHGQGITDLDPYIESLKSLYLVQLYPELAAAKAEEKADAEELAAAEAQVAGVVSTLIEELRLQAESIAAGVVSDAKIYSDRYVARIAACETQDELDDAIEEICAEMAALPLFSNTNTTNGTPFGLYEEQFISRSPKFTLAGALLNWRLGIANK